MSFKYFGWSIKPCQGFKVLHNINQKQVITGSALTKIQNLGLSMPGHLQLCLDKITEFLGASGHPWNPLDPCHDWLVCRHNGHITINTPAPPHPIQTYTHLYSHATGTIRQKINGYNTNEGNTVRCQCQYKHARLSAHPAGQHKITVPNGEEDIENTMSKNC